MKKTNQRFAVFEAVFCNASHPTVEDIVKIVKAKIPMITVESIYRILNDFSNANLIKKMDNTTLMRYDCDTNRHNHLVCTKCKKIVDIQDLDIKLPAELDYCKDLSITINCLCKECASA